MALQRGPASLYSLDETVHRVYSEAPFQRSRCPRVPSELRGTSGTGILVEWHGKGCDGCQSYPCRPESESVFRVFAGAALRVAVVTSA